MGLTSASVPVLAAALTLTWALASGAARAQEAPLGKSGALHKGMGVELVGIGPAEAFTRFGGSGGVSITSAFQMDLGPRWALRVPFSLDLTFRDGDVAYGALAFSPGLVYRWRSFAAQRWIPYLGAGARLASEAVHRDFVGLPLLVTSALDLGEHHHHFSGGADDPNLDAQLSLAPELWAGYEYHPSRWVALILGVTYAWIRIDDETVHLVRETLAVRATL